MDRAAVGHRAQARRGRADVADGDGALAQRLRRRQTLVELLDVLDDVGHLVDGVDAALGGRAVAGDALGLDFDLHAAAVAVVDLQAGRLGRDDDFRTQLAFLDDVLPAQAVAILFLHAGDHPDRQLFGHQPEFLQHRDGADGGDHAALLVGHAAAVDLAVLDDGRIGLDLVPQGDVAHVDGVAVAVEGDDARAVADAAKQVAHAVDDDLVVAHLLHGRGHELDHVALLAAQGGDAGDVFQEIRDLAFAFLGFRVQFRTHFLLLLACYRAFSTPVAALKSSMSLSHSATWAGSNTLFQKSSSQSSRSSSLSLPCCSTQVKYLKLCSAFRSK